MSPEPYQHEQIMDSHFSMGQNKINFAVFALVEERALTARDDSTLPNLESYFNAVYEMYLMFAGVLKEEIIKAVGVERDKYKALRDGLIDGKIQPTMRHFKDLLETIDDIRLLVVTHMQSNFKYFYRLSDRQPKGVKRLSEIMKNNIFVR